MVAALAQLGIAAQRVPLGVDLNFWLPREPARRDPGEPARLLHVASLNRVKDQVTLLRALAELSDSGVQFEMDVVGEDTLHGEIQALAQRSGLSAHVRFHGFVPQRRLLPLLRQAHLLVMSSRHEAGPAAALEAATQGVPTVGTAVGHIAEWAPHAASSVPIGDWSALAHAIAAMLDDEDLRLRIAREALRRATREDADFTARCFHSLYASLVPRAGTSTSTDSPDARARP
jgi:glycosyltransferase involved in cell wall biosynthesis